MTVREASPSYRLRGMLLGFAAALVALTVLSGAGTIVTASGLSRTIATTQEMQARARRAALISVVVREQYIHEAHTIILRDRSHVQHHDEWVHELDRELDALRSEVDERGAARLDAIRSSSARLREEFSGAILPAIDRGDWEEVHHAHDRANALVDDMTADADALAAYFAGLAAEAQRRSESLVKYAFGGSVALAMFAAALAFVAARRLWYGFSMPLGSLEEVARKVTAGERAARVEPVPAAELAVVGEALNRMLDSLAAAETELVHAERLAAVGRVAAVVAHEINNPIAIIRGYVNEMRKEPQTDAIRAELGIIDEEALACQRIAGDLLLYARLPPISKERVAAADLLGQAVARSGATGDGSASVATTSVEAEPAFIDVDPLRIRQVVVNLVRNAQTASPPSDVVVVRGSRRGDGYCIEVLDRGAGVPPEVQARLFEPFFTTRHDGSGLGLAVCHSLVKAHGGSIRAEPREGGGSRFVVELPGVAAAGYDGTP